MKTAAGFAAFFLCLFAAAAMAPAEQQAEYQARKQARIRELNAQHLPFIRRIVNHYPAAEFSAPINEGMK